MYSTNTANTVFTYVYNNCRREIPYNPAWSNGTGYFDFAVYGDEAPQIKKGHMARSVTDGGRRILIIGTRLGNVVIFDRFSEQVGKENAVFVTNVTSSFHQGGWAPSSGALGPFDIEILTGGEYPNENIGWRIEQIYGACKRTSKSVQEAEVV